MSTKQRERKRGAWKALRPPATNTVIITLFARSQPLRVFTFWTAYIPRVICQAEIGSCDDSFYSFFSFSSWCSFYLFYRSNLHIFNLKNVRQPLDLLAENSVCTERSQYQSRDVVKKQSHICDQTFHWWNNRWPECFFYSKTRTMTRTELSCHGCRGVITTPVIQFLLISFISNQDERLDYRRRVWDRIQFLSTCVSFMSTVWNFLW